MLWNIACTYNLNLQEASLKTTTCYRIRITYDHFTEVTDTHVSKNSGQQDRGYSYNHYKYTIISSRRCESYGKSGHHGCYN